MHSASTTTETGTHTHTHTHAHWHTKPVYLNRIAHRRYGPDAGPDDKDPP